MIKSQSALWDECLRLIQANVTEQQFKTWFAPIVFESYSEREHTLMVQVPSPYVYEYLEQYYVGLLRKVLARVFGENVILRYRIITVVGDNNKNTVQEVEGEVPAEIEAPEAVRRGNQSPTTLDAAVPQGLNPQLDPKKTFQNFIEGDSNKLPRTVGLSIAEHPGKTTFNPFFIYGPSGCGKTHLINAIGVRCKEMYPEKRVLYVSARLFQVQFTDASRQNTVNDFINFYQTIDLLIVDDVQEWATAEKTVSTFFHIFDHLFRLGKQIILASDRPPVDLKWLHERMLTRFSCGLIAELEKPTVQLCIDILNSKCRRDGLKIPANVIQYIAETINGSVRDLEGVVNSLMAYILEKVCKHFNVAQHLIISKSRRRDYVQVRQISMYLAQKYTKMSAARIGQLIGNRDHSTVIHSCNTIEQRLKIDKGFSEEVSSIERSFRLKKK